MFVICSKAEREWRMEKLKVRRDKKSYVREWEGEREKNDDKCQSARQSTSQCEQAKAL